MILRRSVVLFLRPNDGRVRRRVDGAKLDQRPRTTAPHIRTCRALSKIKKLFCQVDCTTRKVEQYLVNDVFYGVACLALGPGGTDRLWLQLCRTGEAREE